MRSFKPYPNVCDSVKQTRERRKKPCYFGQKIPMKILSHYPLVLPSKKVHDPRTFCKNLFPPKGSLVNAQQKKKRGKKSKRSGEERKRKVIDEGAGKLSRKTTRNFLEILLSAHARTLRAVIWHRLVNLFSTCKLVLDL